MPLAVLLPNLTYAPSGRGTLIHKVASPTSLAILFPDIAYYISTFLSSYDFRRLRSVSRAFDDVFAPYALRHIKVPFHLARLENEGFRKYETITLESSKLQTCAKSLDFNFPASLMGVKQQEVHWKFRDIWLTISKLNALESLNVVGGGNFPQVYSAMLIELFGSIMSATDGMLVGLALDLLVTADGLPGLCTEIYGLRKLEVRYHFGFPCQSSPTSSRCQLRKLESDISQLMSNSPDLETIHIHRLSDNLDKCGPSSTTALFPNVRALDKSNVPISTLRTHLFPNLRHLYLRSGRGEWDPVWIALKDAGTKLETLTAYQPSPPLVDFLSSFIGLKELAILGVSTADESLFPTLARDFFINAFPNHCSTLNALTLECAGMHVLSDWTFDKMIWSKLHLPVLSILSITPRPRATGLSLETRYQEILEVIESRFPHIRDLRFCCQESDNTRLNGRLTVAEDLAAGAVINLRSLTGCPPICILDCLHFNGGNGDVVRIRGGNL